MVGITSQPATGLANGQYVKINFQNLKPGEFLVFRQCVADPASLAFADLYSKHPADCTVINSRLSGRADASGHGSTYFPVYAYGDDHLATDAQPPQSNPHAPKRLIQCDSQHDCSLVAMTSARHVYLTRISFAPSPADCPQQGANAPLGSGSSAAARAMYRWSASTCLPPRSLSIGYVSHNEHSAYVDFLAGTSDFGVTGLRPGTPEPSPSPGRGISTSPSPSPSPRPSPSPSPRTSPSVSPRPSPSVSPHPSPSVSPGPGSESSPPAFRLAPLSASAAVVAYRAYDNQGTQITTLTLSPETIAGLFMGQIANFSATPAITDLNPGISFPPRTQVVARADYNSETYIFTRWLAAVAPNVWKPPTSPSQDIFPVTGIDLQTGEQAAVRDIIAPPAGFNPQVVHIGLIDSSTAAFNGLPTVRIKQPDGSVVSATSDSILEAIADSQQAPDGTLIPQWNNAADPDAYPLPMISYMMAPIDKIDPVKGETIARFLRYAVQDGQALLSEIDGYAQLPAGLVKASLAVADLIPVPPPAAVPNPTPTPTPTPAPAFVPLPAPDSSTAFLPALPLPNLPALPEAPAGLGASAPKPVAGNGGPAPASCTTPAKTCNGAITLVAALTNSQGMELVAAAHEAPNVPSGWVLPALLGLMLLLTGTGLFLELWARRMARRRR